MQLQCKKQDCFSLFQTLLGGQHILSCRKGGKSLHCSEPQLVFLLCHLLNVGLQGKLFNLLESQFP